MSFCCVQLKLKKELNLHLRQFYCRRVLKIRPMVFPVLNGWHRPVPFLVNRLMILPGILVDAWAHWNWKLGTQWYLMFTNCKCKLYRKPGEYCWSRAKLMIGTQRKTLNLVLSPVTDSNVLHTGKLYFSSFWDCLSFILFYSMYLVHLYLWHTSTCHLPVCCDRPYHRTDTVIEGLLIDFNTTVLVLFEVGHIVQWPRIPAESLIGDAAVLVLDTAVWHTLGEWEMCYLSPAFVVPCSTMVRGVFCVLT